MNAELPIVFPQRIVAFAPMLAPFFIKVVLWSCFLVTALLGFITLVRTTLGPKNTILTYYFFINAYIVLCPNIVAQYHFRRNNYVLPDIKIFARFTSIHEMAKSAKLWCLYLFLNLHLYKQIHVQENQFLMSLFNTF